MRIGLITGEYPPMRGGVGAYSRILAQELARQGNSVFVLSSAKAASSDTGISLDNHIQSWGLKGLRVIARWAQGRQVDIISLQYQTAAYQMSPWVHFLPSVIRHTPIVTTFHDLRFPYLFPKAGRLRDWIVMRLARTSDGVIVTNHEDLQRVQYLRNVKLIPIGSNILDSLPSDYHPFRWREKAHVGREDYLLAYFGLINRSKGLEFLLEGVARLRREQVPASLVVIGDVGASDPTNLAYAQEMKALVDRLNLTRFVHWIGFLENEEDVGSYLKASDVVALPFLDGASYRRGSLMAALRYGCATVTTVPRVTIPAFVSGENMLLVKPGDSDSLAEALRQLYHSPDLRQRLRQGAAKLAGYFDWRQIAFDYTNFFCWVIEAGA